MDNVTHSLIGVALGHGLRPWAARKPAETDWAVLGAAIFAAVFSSNAPDIDILGKYVLPWARNDGLGFLLQHRGYTHAFLLAPVLAALSAALAWAISPRAARGRIRAGGLFAIALVGVLLHIGADSWNDYGVHPFSPFMNRWFYGDFIFIVEPMLWFGLLPLAFFESRRRLARAASAVLWIGMLAAVWFGPVSGVATSLWLTVWAFGWAALGYLRPRLSWGPAAVACLFALACFATGSQVARARIAEVVSRELPAESLAQIGTSPFPGNPLLWRGIVSTISKEGTYTARQFTLSLAPGLLAAPLDYYRSGGSEDSKLDPSFPGLRWLLKFEGSPRDLQRLALRYCRVRGVLGFVRFPFWRESGGKIEVGDLRYDRGGRGFSRVDVDAESTERCPEYYTPWVPPISSVIPILN